LLIAIRDFERGGAKAWIEQERPQIEGKEHLEKKENERQEREKMGKDFQAREVVRAKLSEEER
jgi:hypothetical protein